MLALSDTLTSAQQLCGLGVCANEERLSFVPLHRSFSLVLIMCCLWIVMAYGIYKFIALLTHSYTLALSRIDAREISGISPFEHGVFFVFGLVTKLSRARRNVPLRFGRTEFMLIAITILCA